MGIIVLDVGTSSMRSILFDDAGIKLFTSQTEYSPTYLENDWVEQNPDDWKNAMEKNISASVAYSIDVGEIIKVVAITSQRSSIIPIGSDDKPIGNAIMWQDKRVLDIIKELQPYNNRIFELSGSRINPVFSAAKMTWLRRYRPEIYKNTKKIVVIPDFLIHELTDQWITDATYGSRSLLMNLKTRQWDDELLKIFEVDREKLCDIVEPGSIVGKIKAEITEKTGLPTGIPVISAGGDQQCAALGLGVVKEGVLEVSVGTGGFIIAASNDLPDNLKQDVICNVSAIPGSYILESSIPACASAFNWLLKLCYNMNDDNKKEVLKQVNLEIEESLKHKSELLILPHFQGRGTPDWNSNSKGSFFNLTLGTTRGDIAKALFEGVCLEIEDNIRTIEQYVEKTENIYACGGMVNSTTFTKILSNICEIPVGIFDDNEATGMGGWISAAVAIGLCNNFVEAFHQARKGCTIRRIEIDEIDLPYYRNKKTEYKLKYWN